MKVKMFCVGMALFLPSMISAQNLVSQNGDDRLYNTGLELLQHGEYGAARQNFSELIALGTASDLRLADAQYYEAFCALNLYHGDGTKKIEDFVDRYPSHPRSATAYYDLANFFYAEKNYSRASTYFKKANFPSLSGEQQLTGRFHWGYSLFNLRKMDEALTQFNFSKSLGGQFGPAASYYAGFIELEKADYENAITDLQRAAKSSAYAAIVPHLIAAAYYRQGKYDDLLNYTASLKGQEGLANPEEISLYNAEAHFKKANYTKAVEGYQASLKANPSKAAKGVLLRAGFSFYSLGQDNEAVQYLKSAASDRDSVGFYASYYLGAAYLRQNQKPLALTAFQNAGKFESDLQIAEESQFQQAKILYDLGRPDESIEALEKFIRLYPSSSHTMEVKEILSQAYVNANNYNKAIAYIESMPSRSAAVNRAYQKATLLKGIELFNMDLYAEAVSAFEKSLQYPQDKAYVAEASFWNGEAYSMGRKYEQAAENYLRIIGLSNYQNEEMIPRTRYGLGYAYFNQQQYDRALYNFKEFVNKGSKNPYYPDGLIRLADCHYVTKNYGEALRYYQQVLQFNSPDKDYAQLQAGVILGIQRNYGQAAVALDAVIRNYPQSRFFDEAMFQRAQLDFEEGKYAAAVSGYSRLIQTNKPSKFLPYAYLRRATSNFNLKAFDKTIADYIFILNEFPDHAVANDVLLPLQESLNLAGRSAEFDDHLAKFKTANPEARGLESVEFETAKNLYFNQEYQRAITRLSDYATAYPQSARLNEALYYQAESYYRLKDYPRALEIHRSLSSDFTFSLASRVTVRIAELEYKLGHYEKAIVVFQQLAQIATNKKEQFSAWSGLMESHYMLANYDSADAYAKIILENGNVNAGAQNKASLFLGKSAMTRGDYELAKDEFLSALNTAHDEYGAEAKYLLGEIFFLEKNYKQCYETLIGLNTDFAAYTEWVGKSYLLLSDNFVAMGDLFQAKGTLQSLIENFPLEHIKLLATEKLKQLEKEERQQKEELSEKDSLSNKNK